MMNDHFSTIWQQVILWKILQHTPATFRPSDNPFNKKLLHICKQDRERDVQRSLFYLSEACSFLSPQKLRGKRLSILRRLRYHYLIPDCHPRHRLKGFDDDEKMILSYCHFIKSFVIEEMTKCGFVILSKCIGEWWWENGIPSDLLLTGVSGVAPTLD